MHWLVLIVSEIEEHLVVAFRKETVCVSRKPVTYNRKIAHQAWCATWWFVQEMAP